MQSDNGKHTGKHGKGDMVRELIAKGFSHRQARKAVNAFFETIGQALKRGEPVAIPGGTLRIKYNKRKKGRQWVSLTNIQTGERRFRLVDFKTPAKRIEFKPDLTLDLEPPPHVPTAEELRVSQLVREQIGCTPNRRELNSLLAAIQQADNKFTRLQTRLIGIRERNWKPRNIGDVEALVKQLCWI